MKNFVSSLVLIGLCGTFMVTPMAAYAEDGEASASKDKDSAKKSDSGEGEGESKDGKKSKGSDDVTGGRFAGDPVFVHVAPMNLPVITNEGAEQIVTLVIDIEVKDFDSADNAHTDMPRIRDALMRSLYGGLGNGVLRNGKLVNINLLKSKVTTAVASVLGTDSVRDVLIQGVAQRIF